MAACDFSWLKVVSFFGMGILVFLAFLLIAGGIYWFTGGEVLYGIANILGGIVCIGLAWWVHKNYEKNEKK